MDAVLVALIWLLVYALVVAVVCWIVDRLLATFAPGAAAFGWIVWAIGGLVVLVLLVRTVLPLLGG